jgi:hypothetical protein
MSRQGIIRHWWRWWTGRNGDGPYRRDALVWWLHGGPLGPRR